MKKEAKNKVLFVDWSTKGRDFEALLPLIYFFEKKINWEVEYISIFNLQKILKTKVDLVIINSTIGAYENLEFSRIAEKSNILLFSAIAEGVFVKKAIHGCVWGHVNENMIPHSEELSMLWSKTSYELATEAFPEVEKIYRISGSLGFDKYKIFKRKALDKKDYKKVIGFAGFGFYDLTRMKNVFIDIYGRSQYDLIMSHLDVVHDVLLKLIQNNKDILFLLKPHPSDGNVMPLEFVGLQKNENVSMVQKDTSIVEAIESSDIWMNVYSTSNLEAWLLDKPTISCAPKESVLVADVIDGSLIDMSHSEVQSHIEEYYKNGNIKAFDEKKELREQLIKDYMGFSDGLNHVRFMSFLKPYVEDIEANRIKRGKWKLSFKRRIKEYVKHFLYLLSKGKYDTLILKRWAKPYDIFKQSDIVEAKQMRYKDFDKYYLENKDKIQYIYDNWHKDWKYELKMEQN